MGAAAVAEFIRRTIESKKIVCKGSGDLLGTVTLSLGVAAAIAGETADEVVERADRALYMSKSGGRNRVTRDKGLRLRDAANG